ncbi:hypothetical protein KKH43_05175 [Patescibacteria group bacterium]|nr:hypothetical protein [Patescibacteria group bacterium]
MLSEQSKFVMRTLKENYMTQLIPGLDTKERSMIFIIIHDFREERIVVLWDHIRDEEKIPNHQRLFDAFCSLNDNTATTWEKYIKGGGVAINGKVVCWSSEVFGSVGSGHRNVIERALSERFEGIE